MILGSDCLRRLAVPVREARALFYFLAEYLSDFPAGANQKPIPPIFLFKKSERRGIRALVASDLTRRRALTPDWQRTLRLKCVSACSGPSDTAVSKADDEASIMDHRLFPKGTLGRTRSTNAHE